MYFATNELMYIEELEGYDVTNFLGEIGGQLGLLTGFSLLSVVTLVEIVFRCCRKRAAAVAAVVTGGGDALPLSGKVKAGTDGDSEAITRENLAMGIKEVFPSGQFGSQFHVARWETKQ